MGRCAPEGKALRAGPCPDGLSAEGQRAYQICGLYRHRPSQACLHGCGPSRTGHFSEHEQGPPCGIHARVRGACPLPADSRPAFRAGPPGPYPDHTVGHRSSYRRSRLGSGTASGRQPRGAYPSRASAGPEGGVTPLPLSWLHPTLRASGGGDCDVAPIPVNSSRVTNWVTSLPARAKYLMCI